MFRQQVKQITAVTRDEVMTWLETTPHHIANKEDPKVLILKGHHNILRVPYKLWKRCFVKPGGKLDARMYRWDFEAHKAHVLKLRDKRRKSKNKRKTPQSMPKFDEDLAYSGLR